MKNPYKVVQIAKQPDGEPVYGIKYVDKVYSAVEFPDSWGTKKHAFNYMVSMLGLSPSEYAVAHKNHRI